MEILGKYKVEMIVKGYKTQALEGKLERKKGEDGERDGAQRHCRSGANEGDEGDGWRSAGNGST